jgi:hypothetical protein
MKRYYIPLLLLTFIFLIVSMEGCDLLSISIEDRIDNFENDINNDRANAYLNFVEGSTDWYIGIQDPDFWDQPFDETKRPFTITVVNSSNELNVICSITGAAGYLFGPEIIFKMIQVDSDWYIEEIPSMENYTFGKVVD